MNPDSLYPTPPMQGSVPYIDGYGRTHAQIGVGPAGEGFVAYESGNGVSATNADAPTAGDTAGMGRSS